jgi:hypothetical protein
MTTFDEAAGWVPPSQITLSELAKHQPGAYATTTPAPTMSKVPPVASRGAKQLWSELTEYPEARDHVGAALDVIAQHDPRDVMDLRWAWKVKAPLE